MKPGFFKRFLHPVCLLGLLIFVVGFGASCVALVIDVLEEEQRAYQGLLTFILYPGVMFLGLLVVSTGLILERRRTRALTVAHREWTPALDVKKRRHQWMLFAMVAFGASFVMASVVGAYRAYEFTESEEFCGSLCHTPMEPQYVAHQNSSHASIHCTQCHVGPGVRGYMNAKISGLRQLYQMVGASYPAPIFAPRAKLPAVSHMCESCHSDQQFRGKRFASRMRFGYDLENSRRYLQILFNVGGGDSPQRAGEGIHWHMSIKNSVWFRSTDDRQQDIPWIKLERPDGTVVVYKDRESKLTDEELSRLPEAQMNCLDCHSRPAHHFLTPAVAVDAALDSGKIRPSLPFIKKVAVKALVRNKNPDETKEEAVENIRTEIESYYREHFQGTVLERKETLESAITTVQDMYRANTFPAMKLDGFTHPDNIGHRNFPGCFRCHSGRHVTSDGQVLSNECSLCHGFFEKRRDSESLIAIPVDGSSLHPFQHEEHGKVSCWTCHSGTSSPYVGCGECHEKDLNSHGMEFECSICHKPGATKVSNKTCGPCHPMGASEMHVHQDHGDCISCHKPHTWEVAMPASCFPCHEKISDSEAAKHYPGKPCLPCHEFTGVQVNMMGLPVERR